MGRNEEQSEITIRELPIPCGGYSMRATLYSPFKEQYPVVIFCHALGACRRNFHLTACELAESGIGALTFDFRGGSNLDQSGFPTRNMTVLTEKEDLAAVYRFLSAQTFLKSVSLFGASQGGMVAAMFAEEFPEAISALVLLYPGFCIADHLRARYPDEVPDCFDLFGMQIGKEYVLSMRGYEVFREIGSYSGPVLIFHGEADSLVPISYSERAAALYPNARLLPLRGEGHGFSAAGNAYAARESVKFFLSSLPRPSSKKSDGRSL